MFFLLAKENSQCRTKRVDLKRMGPGPGVRPSRAIRLPKMASALWLCALAPTGKAAGIDPRASSEIPAPAPGAARGATRAAPLSRRSAFAGATLWWAGIGEVGPRRREGHRLHAGWPSAWMAA